MLSSLLRSLSSAQSVQSSWTKTKQTARNKVYFDHSITKYCGCSYESKGVSGGVIDTESCGYDGSQVKYKNAITVLDWEHVVPVLDWEHVVPASLTPARQMDCWVDDSRSQCEKNSQEAKKIIFDLHNLVPSVGQANRIRSDSRYGIIEGEERKLGSCDFEWTKDVVEPSEGIRGDLARAWLYMNYKHDVVISEDEYLMFLKWSINDPLNDWEFTRNARIKELQGNSSVFVDMFIK
jgi:deoxyribonuclease-1